MRILITGMGGFVATHLGHELRQAGHEVWGTDYRDGIAAELASHKILRADLRKRDEVMAVVEVSAPEVIIHLGAQSVPARSWELAKLTFDVNVHGARHVMEAAAATEGRTKVVLVSSSDVYGAPGPDLMPLAETAPFAPLNPYAVSKISAEMLCGVYSRRLDVPLVVLRSFSHTGPGQPPDFVVPAFAYRVAKIEAGLETVLSHGDLASHRDFTDVRDVVRAYRLVAESSLESGTFNVCSGRSTSIREVLEFFVSQARAEVRCERNEMPPRGDACTEFRGDGTRLRETVGWQPQHTLEDSLRDVLDDYREAVRLQQAEEAAAGGDA